MKKVDKKTAVADLNDKFAAAKGLVLTDYKGMTVEEISQLRDILRAQSIQYKVVKNTLARIAVAGTPAEPLSDQFKGPIGIAMGFDDAASLAKTLLAFAKKNEKLKVKCGVVDGTFCTVEQLQAISKLPSREVLLAMIAGTMQAPAAQMARLLSATVTQFGYAMTALRDKKAQEGAQ